MFHSDDADAVAPRARSGGLLSRASILVLLLPIAAFTGVSGLDDPPPVRSVSTPEPPAGFRIRCWQEGQLLLDEDRVGVPSAGGPVPGRAIAVDRRGHPLLLAETANATCLIQAADMPPGAG